MLLTSRPIKKEKAVKREVTEDDDDDDIQPRKRICIAKNRISIQGGREIVEIDLTDD